MAKQHVLGWKHSAGEFNGQRYDYVTVYMMSRLQRKDNQQGYAGVELRGEPALAEHLKKINFNGPIPCEVETETMAIGKGQSVEMVVSVTPLKPQTA